MTASAYPKILYKDYGTTRTAIGNQLIPAGTYALRRAHYLNKIEQGLLLSAEQQQVFINLI
ncbi:MAG: hypothetical protein WC216_06610 [Gallionella sp.]